MNTNTGLPVNRSVTPEGLQGTGQRYFQGLNFRQRCAMAVILCAMYPAFYLLKWIWPGTFAELLAVMGRLIPSDAGLNIMDNAAKNGAIREAEVYQDRVQQFMGSIRPDSQWTFHKDNWGPHEVVVLPRVIDSNTGVVTGPEGNPALGSVIVNDSRVPNCEPAALNKILYGDVPAIQSLESQQASRDGTQGGQS